MSIVEEDFDKKELAELKRALTARGIPFTKSIDDPEMSLQLPNFTVLFFYKNNGQKLYNAGITPNECNVKYLSKDSYTPNLEAVLDIVQQHIYNRYVAYETRKNNDRANNKIMREIEEILNENGVESRPPNISTPNTLILPNKVDILFQKKLGMVQFSLLDRNGASSHYFPLSEGNYTLDLFEIIKAYKRKQCKG